MITLPKKITVGGTTYSVEAYKVVTVDGKTAFGSTVFDSLRVLISTDDALPPEQQWRALLHEMLHVLDNEFQIGLKHRQVYVLESALWALFKQNKATMERMIRQ